MNTITDISQYQKPGAVATIGFFDGVHLGHRYLLQQVSTEAARRGLRSMAITFANHPRHTLCSDYKPCLITTLDEKIAQLETTGIDDCVVLDFTHEMAQLSARDFMESYLKEKLGVECLIIGYDHRFGSNRSEGFIDYTEHGHAIGIDVLRAEACTAADITVSSSAVRRFLEAGNVDKAKECLGHTYTLTGKVVEGQRVGRQLGFPTANLLVNTEKIVPGRGVYAVRTEINGHKYGAMLNIGWRPTLNNGSHSTIEVHIFDFNGDLYGKDLTIAFESRLRDEQKFDNLEALQAQLQADKITARKYFNL